MSRPSRAPLLLLAVLAALGVAAVALGQSGGGSSAPRITGATGPTGVDRSPPPAPSVALPRAEAGLAAALTQTTRRLRLAIAAWTARGGAGRTKPPRDVTLLALHQQRLYRRLADNPARADRVVARLGPELRAEAREIVLARRALGRISRSGRPPAVRTAAAAPAETLRRAYTRAERRFRVPREVLAAVNFVESAFGRVRSASEAGARGPMQFLPATWRQYGLGGDIDDDADAILGAANYLRASGAPGDLRRALLAYNHSAAYGSAILRFAHRMRTDPRTFYAFYAWQVFVRTDTGVRWITGPR
ncbi:MAG: lytic murein transglycosylase [Solirubrobacteraceae bacterium]